MSCFNQRQYMFYVGLGLWFSVNYSNWFRCIYWFISILRFLFQIAVSVVFLFRFFDDFVFFYLFGDDGANCFFTFVSLVYLLILLEWGLLCREVTSIDHIHQFIWYINMLDCQAPYGFVLTIFLDYHSNSSWLRWYWQYNGIPIEYIIWSSVDFIQCHIHYQQCDWWLCCSQNWFH